MRRVDNPKNRFEATEVVFDDGEAPLSTLRVHEERAKEIVAENDSPDIPFRYGVNPYRGCQHACAYCYARPSHQYWGFGAGTDFEREIVVKVNAVERLRATFDSKRWRGELLAFSGNTDCYQPLEGRYELTRQLLELCLEYRNPVAIITKSALVARDAELIAELSRRASARVFISIPFADDEGSRAIEPGAPLPHRRFEALRVLSEHGIETGVAMAPLIPGLNDGQIAEVLRRARDAGARHAFRIALRLPQEVEGIFRARLRQALPLRADKVDSALMQIRGGKWNESRFGARMRGQGPRWQAIEDLFELTCKKLGLGTDRTEARPDTFERPTDQLMLF
ncbi:MAG: PA0069 family radical SAM protein [Myxococcales bacterium]